MRRVLALAVLILVATTSGEISELRTVFPGAGGRGVGQRASAESAVRQASSASALTRRVYVPLVLSAPLLAPTATSIPTATPNSGGDVATALSQLNAARSLAGAPAVQPLPALVTAAQNHVNYTEANYLEPAAWADGAPGHSEVAGYPEFTGAQFTDRITYVGASWYHWAGEVITFEADPRASVGLWLGAIYHRLVVLDPRAAYVGFAEGGGGLPTEVMDVTDSANAPADGVFVYPANDQTSIPTTCSEEVPSPLPVGVSGPVGYPISLQTAGSTLALTSFELDDGNGLAVPTYLVPNLAASAYAVLPQQPLQSQSRYTVRAVGTFGATPFDRTWSFWTQ